MQDVKDIHKDGFLIIANLLVSKAKKKDDAVERKEGETGSLGPICHWALS